MNQQLEATRTKTGRSVKIIFDNSANRVKAIHDAVAGRAYRIFESRNFAPGHDWEDWLLAESQIVRPLQCGLLELDGRISLTTDASCFERGEITAYVEPRSLTLAGIAGPCKEPRKPEAAKTDLRGELIFRAMDLPHEVNPFGVKAKFNGCMLELSLPKAGAARETPAQAKAA
jgi:HSP20 family molecular chaperone IbpA